MKNKSPHGPSSSNRACWAVSGQVKLAVTAHWVDCPPITASPESLTEPMWFLPRHCCGARRGALSWRHLNPASGTSHLCGRQQDTCPSEPTSRGTHEDEMRWHAESNKPFSVCIALGFSVTFGPTDLSPPGSTFPTRPLRPCTLVPSTGCSAAVPAPVWAGRTDFSPGRCLDDRPFFQLLLGGLSRQAPLLVVHLRTGLSFPRPLRSATGT